MIAWLILVGLLLLLLTASCFAFGWLCGRLTLRALKRRKPPLPPPI